MTVSDATRVRARSRRTGLAAWCLALPALAVAQEGGGASDPQLGEIRVQAGGQGNALGSSDAASQGSASAADIAARPALRTGEILEFVPGLVVVQHSGGGKANQYFLRGFNLDHGTEFATYVDGMPVNMRTHAHGQGYTDLNFLIPELVGRVDYRKGPYYAEEGDFASAGSARMRLPDTLPQGLAVVTGGTRGYGRTLLADSVDWNQGKLLYGLEAATNRGPFDNSDRMRRFNALLRYSAGSESDGYSLTAMAYASRWNATDQIPQRAVDSGLIGRLGAIDPSDGGTTARTSLSYALRRSNAGGSGRFTLEAFVVRSRLDLFSNLTYFTDDPVNGDQFVQRERRTMAGVNLAQSWSATLGGLDMQNRIGLQTRIDRLAPVGFATTVERRALRTIREDRVREGSVAVFAENTTQWTDKVRSVAGLRVDAFRFAVDSNLPANSGRVRDHIASPKLALVFGPWADTEYFVSAGRGFHSNDARGVTARTNPRTGGAVDPSAPLVGSRGMEVGVRSEAIPGLQTSLALWKLDIGSELLFNGEAGETEASRPTKRYGIEWTNRYKAGRWAQLDADVALSRTRFADTDAAGPYVPGAIGKVVSLGVTVPQTHGWFGSLHVRYFGPRVLVEDNSVRSRSSALTSARVGYAIDRNTQIALDVFNLFDRKVTDSDYYYATRLRGESVAVNDVIFHPAEPRTVRVSLTHRF